MPPLRSQPARRDSHSEASTSPFISSATLLVTTASTLFGMGSQVGFVPVPKLPLTCEQVQQLFLYIPLLLARLSSLPLIHLFLLQDSFQVQASPRRPTGSASALPRPVPTWAIPTSTLALGGANSLGTASPGVSDASHTPPSLLL